MNNAYSLGKRVPPTTMRRYHPKKKDIRNHMYTAVTKLRLSKLDQENLALSIDEWKVQRPSDLFYFRGYGQIKVDETSPVKKEDEMEGEDDLDAEDVKVNSYLSLFMF